MFSNVFRGVGWIERELGDMVLLRGSTPSLLDFSSSRRAALTLPCDMSLANFLGLSCWCRAVASTWKLVRT